MTTNDARRLLTIYLRDHDAASVGGVRLIHRSQRANRGNDFGQHLVILESAVRADQQTLHVLMHQLGISPSNVKRAVTAVAEGMGRFKFNGRLAAYSPLSRVVELEAIVAAVAAKRCLWSALLAVSEADQRLHADTLRNLMERADQQIDAARSMHRDAVAIAFQVAP